MNTKDLASFQNAKGTVESKSERNRKIRIPKGIRPSEMLDIWYKVKQRTEKKNLRLQFRYQRRIYTPSFVFYQQPLWLLKVTFGHQTKVSQKVRKMKMYFKLFFIFLERTSTFIISLFRALYRSSSSDAFTKKDILLQVRSYLQRNTHVERLHGCSSVNCLTFV